ncbi:CD276 antigen homolog isoform X1 [Salvelinus alpinus]|uniref:CD276 antigen homolog isoform X1 n=1 Tax=Salvelinus alpinus TaxID=8036 RepID=UPI0039FBBDF0
MGMNTNMLVIERRRIISESVFSLRGISTLVFIFLLFAHVASEHLVTGIIGESVLLPCDLNLSINPARLRFHWQDHSDVVLYSFNKRVEQEYQNKLYTNRTNAFQVEMSSGNISIELRQVTPQDNQKTYWAFASLFDRIDQTIHFTKVCQTTLLVAGMAELFIALVGNHKGHYYSIYTWHFMEPFSHFSSLPCTLSARFLTPKLTVKYKAMNAMCLTQGGYPKPKVTWTIQDLSQPQNGTLEPREVQTNITLDPESGLYTVWSQVNFKENYTDNHSVTCQVFNPVLRETVSNTTIIRTSEGLSLSVIVGITLLMLICVGGIIFVYKQCCGTSGGEATANSVAAGSSEGATGGDE